MKYDSALTKYDSTTSEEMFFHLPEYSGKEYTLKCKGRRMILARLSPDGSLYISKGYCWNKGLTLCSNVTPAGDSETYLASLVLDVLRQMYRLNHTIFAYDKPCIHRIYWKILSDSKVDFWKKCVYYSWVKVRCLWKGFFYKWRV